jgi:hypothetical protein
MMRFLYNVVCQVIFIGAPIAGLLIGAFYLGKAFWLFVA